MRPAYVEYTVFMRAENRARGFRVPVYPRSRVENVYSALLGGDGKVCSLSAFRSYTAVVSS